MSRVTQSSVIDRQCDRVWVLPIIISCLQQLHDKKGDI